MITKFYYGSGSPFSWAVWLVLEHKQIAYELILMSLQNGDLKKLDFLSINPHGKVPVLVDDDFNIWESLAIVEYLQERYPLHPVLPSDIKEKAVVRRIAAEIHSYLYPALRRLLEQTLFRVDGDGDPVEIESSLKGLAQQLDYFESLLQNPYCASDLSLADFTLYPLLALAKRLEEKQPQHGVAVLIGPKLTTFMQNIEQLPYFHKTTPPHWKG
ncbi:MAG: glutathione S-transferase family protein [Methylococcales bacterium]